MIYRYTLGYKLPVVIQQITNNNFYIYKSTENNTWSGYKIIFQTSGGYSTSTTLTTNLPINGFTPASNKIYNADTTVQVDEIADITYTEKYQANVKFYQSFYTDNVIVVQPYANSSYNSIYGANQNYGIYFPEKITYDALKIRYSKRSEKFNYTIYAQKYEQTSDTFRFLIKNNKDEILFSSALLNLNQYLNSTQYSVKLFEGDSYQHDDNSVSDLMMCIIPLKELNIFKMTGSLTYFHGTNLYARCPWIDQLQADITDTWINETGSTLIASRSGLEFDQPDYLSIQNNIQGGNLYLESPFRGIHSLNDLNEITKDYGLTFSNDYDKDIINLNKQFTISGDISFAGTYTCVKYFISLPLSSEITAEWINSAGFKFIEEYNAINKTFNYLITDADNTTVLTLKENMPSRYENSYSGFSNDTLAFSDWSRYDVHCWNGYLMQKNENNIWETTSVSAVLPICGFFPDPSKTKFYSQDSALNVKLKM